MKTFFFKITIAIVIVFISCNTTTSTVLAEECPIFLQNDYNKWVIIEHQTNVDNKVQTYNEARYTCVYDVNYLSKVMFDAFGKWDKKSTPDYGTQKLVWEKVQLFNDEKTYFHVETSGVELKTKVFTSVSVFSQDGDDLLNDTSPLKKQLITYFGNLIKNNDDTKVDFYDF